MPIVNVFYENMLIRNPFPPACMASPLSSSQCLFTSLGLAEVWYTTQPLISLDSRGSDRSFCEIIHTLLSRAGLIPWGKHLGMPTYQPFLCQPVRLWGCPVKCLSRAHEGPNTLMEFIILSQHFQAQPGLFIPLVWAGCFHNRGCALKW